jgi:hypothetical protein
MRHTHRLQDALRLHAEHVAAVVDCRKAMLRTSWCRAIACCRSTLLQAVGEHVKQGLQAQYVMQDIAWCAVPEPFHAQ